MPNNGLTHAQHTATALAARLLQATTPVLRIHGLAGAKRWKRNVASGSRIGPWLQANYDILDQAKWKAKTPCMYCVVGNDGVLRYVGISRNRMADRWRESPALDAQTMQPLPKRQLFHSQCWAKIEKEVAVSPGSTYVVSCITGEDLTALIAKLGPPLSGFSALGDDKEGVVAAVERWLCNHSHDGLVRWNTAMTRR